MTIFYSLFFAVHAKVCVVKMFAGNFGLGRVRDSNFKVTLRPGIGQWDTVTWRCVSGAVNCACVSPSVSPHWIATFNFPYVLWRLYFYLPFLPFYPRNLPVQLANISKFIATPLRIPCFVEELFSLHSKFNLPSLSFALFLLLFINPGAASRGLLHQLIP